LTRRILTIALAIVMAVIGVVVVLIYVRGADQRAIAGQQAVTVLVAAQQVPAGTTASAALSEGLLSSQKLPAQSVPFDAVRSITPDLKGLVLSSDLPSGQLLLRPILVTAVQAATGLPIPSGKVAVTILMCVQKAVAGYVHAGSTIAVFNTFYSGSAGSVTTSCAGTNWGKGARNIHTRLVLNNVPVLAVGTASANAAGSATTTGAFSQGSASSTQTTIMVTVAVDQADAERVIELAEAYIPYMALMTSSSGTAPDVTFKP
jgi:pilus assembly protein CpaB